MATRTLSKEQADHLVTTLRAALAHIEGTPSAMDRRELVARLRGFRAMVAPVHRCAVEGCMWTGGERCTCGETPHAPDCHARHVGHERELVYEEPGPGGTTKQVWRQVRA